MLLERQRVTAARTAQSKPAVERLYRVAARNECAASQRRGEKKDECAIKLELHADPMRGIENEGEQGDGDTEEGEEKRRAQSFGFRFEGLRCHSA